MVVEPIVADATTAEAVLVWRWPEPVAALSSAAVGGGAVMTRWLVNIGVPTGYRRTDLDDHVASLADELTLVGDGIGLFTAAAVSAVTRAEVDGVVAHATVSLSKPTWAADPSGFYTDWSAGTINVVAQLPSALGAGAAVNAVITATEAKTQALIELGIPGTGTASDAVAVISPWGTATERFGGPRSRPGSALGRAVHAAVLDGARRCLERTQMR